MRRVLGEAAVPLAVARLQAKFEYPERKLDPQPIARGGGGGAPSVVVAASDATDLSKSKADYVCTGTKDHETIQAAVDLLHAASVNDGGRVLLTEGTFNIALDAIDLGENIWLSGVNHADTLLSTTDTTGDFIVTGNENKVSDLRIAGVSVANATVGISSLSGDRLIVTNVLFAAMGTAIETGNHALIYGNIANVPIFVDDTSGYINVTVTANTNCGLIRTANTSADIDNWIVTDNVMFNQIEISRCNGFVVADNIFDDPSGDNDALITIDQSDDGIVEGNASHNAAGYDAIVLTACTGVIVAENTLDSLTHGILVSASSRCIIEGNILGEGASDYLGEHGIQLSGSSDNLIRGNLIVHPGQDTDNTFDGIILDGNSDRNDIWDNKIIGDSGAVQPRYGINISAATCDDNSYLGNRTGPAGDYGTGTYNDAGTGTVNTWPGAAAPQGDNLL